MAKQLKLPLPRETAQLERPHAPLVHVAQEFAARYGRSASPEHLSSLQVDPIGGTAVHRAYAAGMGGATDTPELRSSYAALVRETGEMYDRVTGPPEKGGLGIEVRPVERGLSGSAEDARSMMRSVRKGVIEMNPTTPEESHAFLTPEENDRFRVVHDLFGHAATGRSFSRHGEEAAYRMHASMYSEEARPALASETRGQNSYLNFGGGSFPDQSEHLVGLPSWATGTGNVELPEPEQPKRQIPLQGKLF
jgi:hypothetical protein